MAVVKNKLKVFEAVTDTDNMASAKPQTPLKPPTFGQNISPALQKFMNKQNEALAGKESQGSVSEEARTPLRNGLGSGGQSEQNVNNTPAVQTNRNIANRPTVGALKPENRRSSQVVVPDIFKQESVNSTSQPEGRRGSEVNISEASKPSTKNTFSFSENSSSDENTKPKPFAKPGSTFPRPPPKPVNAETPAKIAPALLPKKPSDIKSEEKKQQLFPRDSTKVKLPGVDHLQLKNTIPSSASGITPLASSSITSQPSSSPNEATVTDLRNMLRPTKTQIANELTEKKKPVAIKPVFPPGASSFTKEAETKNAQDKPDLSAQLCKNKWTPNAQEMKRQNSSAVVERKSDSKKFKKVKIEDYPPISTPPKKPPLPGNVDLTIVKQQYQRTIQTLQERLDTSGRNEDDETDDIYDDGTSVDDSALRKPSNNRKSERISIIPDMTAEEEGVVYDDGHTPLSPLRIPRPPVLVPEGDDMYVDAETERKVKEEEEDLDQLYEDEETFAISAEKLEEDRKRRQKEEAEAKKREEKERREKEKEEEKKRKKEEKERAKKEKEEMQLRKKFNLTGDEIMVGEGIIKQDIKGGVLGGLSLKKGQTVTIVRLDNNPANKWLVRSDTGMGYIDSSNIEVDPNIIKQAMTNQAKGTRQSKSDDDQPLYDDVPQVGHVNDLEDDGEIYEECP